MDPNDPYIRALLNTMAGTESAGSYNVMYGGKRFDSFADHPRQMFRITSGPNKGKLSSAAGKYQFVKGTWDQQKQKLGLPDFSPRSQDLAAADLARTEYGKGFEEALRSGDPNKIAGVGRKLAGQWTSLPGGIEAGTNDSKFANAFQKHLSSLIKQPNMVAGSPPMTAPPPQMQATAERMPPLQPQQQPHPDFGRPPQPGPSSFPGSPPQMAGIGAGLSSKPPSMPPPPPPTPPPSSGFGATASAGVSPGVGVKAPSVGGGGFGGILSAIAGLGGAMGGNQQAQQAAQQANDEATRRRIEWARANGFA